MARYDGALIISADTVCKDFFPHLTLPKFLRKVDGGQIKLPLMRMEDSQKSAKGVDIRDLAVYLDARREEAQRAYEKLNL